ncbi:MAG: DNA polymerase III subunit gamma/tau [Actinobacteria bacterium]|nr:DNA polymerase III subunit gamma/tau [Actinomycetota bacterium]
MAFQSLYRRYRPRRFGEVRGQDHVVRGLRNAVATGTVSHAYLFSGPRGTGKTSTARILAKALNCQAPVDGEPCCACPSCLAVEAGTSLDVSELDAASNNGVDAMRDLVARVALAGAGRTRLYILDEVHMLSPGASNALLKTLEEPPAHVVFVLATTDPQKVLPTIRSRTQAFEFRLLPATTLVEHLRWVVADAGLDVDDQAIELAVRRGQGSARDALSALEQIVAAGTTVDDDAVVEEMAEALCERDTARALTAVATACGAGRDARHLAEALLAHLRDAFLSVVAPEVVSLPDVAREAVADQGRRLGAAAAVRSLDAVGEALLAMRDAPDARVVLEVALVRATRPEADTSPAALLERIERLEQASRRGTPPTGAGPSSPPAVAPAGSAREAARQAVTAVGGRPGEVGGDVAAPAVPPGEAPSRPALGALRRDQVPAPPASPATPAAPPAPASPATPAAPPPPASSRPGSAGAPAASGPLPTREELTLAWADHILGRLRPVAKGRFAAGRFAAVDEEAITFALPSEAMRRMCEDRLDEVEAALAAFLGRPARLRLTVDGPTAADVADSEVSEGDAAEAVDLDELDDAPPDSRSQLDRLSEVFPGAELVEDPRPGPTADRRDG